MYPASPAAREQPRAARREATGVPGAASGEPECAREVPGSASGAEERYVRGKGSKHSSVPKSSIPHLPYRMLSYLSDV